jgi:chromosomal replication initiator protein
MDINLDTEPIKKEINSVWKECLSLIKKEVPLLTYNTWFLPIKPIELLDSTIKIQVPSKFFMEWIDEHYKTIIGKTIKQTLGDDGKLVYVVLEEKDLDRENLIIQNSENLLTPIQFPKIEKNSILKCFNLSLSYFFNNQIVTFDQNGLKSIL